MNTHPSITDQTTQLHQTHHPPDKLGRSRRCKPIKPPPEYWVTKCTKEGLSDTQISSRWVNELTKEQRRTCFRMVDRYAATMSAAQQRVANGTADVRTLNYVKNGGKRKHESSEAAEMALQIAKIEAAARRSADLLNFRIQHTAGCSIAGCVFAPSPFDTPVQLLLFEYDHREEEQKVAYVTSLSGEVRSEELTKTDCKCLWHHFIHTRDQSGHQPAQERNENAKRDLAAWKERTGCQHPCHSNMAHAELVPAASDDPLMCGFLEVSHVTRGVQWSSASKLNDLKLGQAVVHCKFCHRLYTLCEDAQMYDTPFTQDQYFLLLKYHPAFVQHFLEVTAGFDWKAELLRIKQQRSMGHRKKKLKTQEDFVTIPTI